MTDPILFEAQLARRIEHDDSPDETQRFSVKFTSVGLDLSSDPRLVADQTSRFDRRQGAAISAARRRTATVAAG